MLRESVAVVKAGSDIKKDIEQALELLGGMKRFIQPGDRVALKPNFVCARAPDIGVTTRLDVVEAIIDMVRELGATPIIYERPGMEFDRERVFKALGIFDWAKRVGVELAEYATDSELVRVGSGDSMFTKRLRLPGVLLESKIINIPKMKTHVCSTMSCAIKNFIGVLPMDARRWLHLMGVHGPLADLAGVISPMLTIVDATTCMQGLGPSYGDPIDVGLIVAGADMIAVDQVCARLMGLHPQSVKYLRLAMDRYGERDVEVLGENIHDVAKQFDIPEETTKMDFLFRAVTITDMLFYSRISKYPLNQVLFATGRLGTNAVIDGTKCDRCGKCISVCPFPEAIDPVTFQIDYKLCIRCLNCVYACDRNAVSVSGMSKPSIANPDTSGTAMA